MKTDSWALVTDEEIGRLFRIEPLPSGRAHVIFEDEIRNSWEEHQHGRPSPLHGKTGHTYASWGHEEDTRRNRFAKEIAVWLEQQADRLQISRIGVFGGPRFLGALRGAWSPRFALRVDEYPGNLAHLAEGELASHHSILGLVQLGIASP